MMKPGAASVLLSALCVLSGCKSKGTVSESASGERYASVLVSDSVHAGAVLSCSRAGLSLYDGWGCIEFADSGGTLVIDGGSVSAKGVRAYRKGIRASRARSASVSLSEDSTATRSRRESSAEAWRAARQQPERQGVQALRWYQRAAYRIGALCCALAALAAIVRLRRKR